MQQDPEDIEHTKNILEKIRRLYGYIPVVNQVLSERPDIFIPASDLSGALFHGRSSFDPKVRHLIALAAAAAAGGEHCMRAQMKDAKGLGATEDEVLEVLAIASYMCMTRSQSYSLREFAAQYEKDTTELE